MKGRLTYQQVNTFIDEMNKACKSKYKLLRQKKSTLNDANRKRFETLKMQESKDTAGAYFVTESDLQEWSNVKLSKENRSILTVLRHCGRMYEIRSGSLVRYAVVDLY
nr:hypothetical protein BaRGS_006094 [Batillaria attramentaria]